MLTDTQTHTPIPTLDSLHKHILPSRIQERFSYTHAALHATCLIISQVWEVFLVRDSRIADCAVRRSVVERSISSLQRWWVRTLFIHLFMSVGAIELQP